MVAVIRVLRATGAPSRTRPTGPACLDRPVPAQAPALSGPVFHNRIAHAIMPR